MHRSKLILPLAHVDPDTSRSRQPKRSRITQVGHRTPWHQDLRDPE